MTNIASVRRAGQLCTRTASEADAAILADFAAVVFNATFGPDNTPHDMALYLSHAFGVAQQTAELRDPERTCLLVEDGGQLVGYALLRCADASCELQRLYVDAAWHGLGVADRLMRECLRVAHAQAATTIWLGVWERNPRAIRFYVKHGFTDVGAQAFCLGTDMQTDRVMSRSVDVSDA